MQHAVKRYDELITSGYLAKSSGGLLVDILRQPLKYQTIDAGTAHQEGERSLGRAVPRLVESPEDVPTARTAVTASFMLRKVALPDAVKAEATELYLHGHVSAAELAALALDDDPDATVFGWRRRTHPPG